MLLFVILLCVAELENDSKLLYSVEVWWVGDTFCAANVRFPPNYALHFLVFLCLWQHYLWSVLCNKGRVTECQYRWITRSI